MVFTGVVDLTDATDDDNDNLGTILVPKVEVDDIPMKRLLKNRKLHRLSMALGILNMAVG